MLAVVTHYLGRCFCFLDQRTRRWAVQAGTRRSDDRAAVGVLEPSWDALSESRQSADGCGAASAVVVVVAIALSGHGPVSLFSSLRLSQLDRIHTRRIGDAVAERESCSVCGNYMGWENASPVIQRSRARKKTHPRAMF